MAELWLTDAVIDVLPLKVSPVFSRWPEIVRQALTEVINFPPGLVRYLSCFRRQEGTCRLRQEPG